MTEGQKLALIQRIIELDMGSTDAIHVTPYAPEEDGSIKYEVEVWGQTATMSERGFHHVGDRLMAVCFTFADPMGELIRAAEEAEERRSTAPRLKDKHRQGARATAFKEAVQVLDVAERNRETGEPCEMRGFKEIVNEREETK